MFDIAWSELFVIMIVALVVVGPKDLPKLMRTAGQWAGRARAMADQFRRSFEDMARQTELDELRNQVTKLRDEATKPMTDLDYKSYGIEFPKDPLAPVIEEVGAAAPKLDGPVLSPPGAPAVTPTSAASAPAAPQEAAKLAPPSTGTTG
jgi:sec-independent protein translocase protein TatB